MTWIAVALTDPSPASSPTTWAVAPSATAPPSWLMTAAAPTWTVIVSTVQSPTQSAVPGRPAIVPKNSTRRLATSGAAGRTSILAATTEPSP